MSAREDNILLFFYHTLKTKTQIKKLEAAKAA